MSPDSLPPITERDVLNRVRSFPKKPIIIITLLQVKDENLENALRQVTTLRTAQFRTDPYCRCETVKPNWHPPSCVFETEVVTQSYVSCDHVVSKLIPRNQLSKTSRLRVMWIRCCSVQLNEYRGSPLTRFHLLQHVNATRDSILKTRQWKCHWLQNAREKNGVRVFFFELISSRLAALRFLDTGQL